MEKDTEIAIRQLWLTYKQYGELSKGKKKLDTSEYASSCVKGFLEYLDSACEAYPSWKANQPSIIYNEIRILGGLIECYDRPVHRETSNKTRWCL